MHSAVYEDGQTPVPEDNLIYIQSIDSLFSEIHRNLLRTSQYILMDVVQIDYRAEYGYPEFVTFDSDSMTDAYVSYHVELLDIIVWITPQLSFSRGYFQ